MFVRRSGFFFGEGMAFTEPAALKDSAAAVLAAGLARRFGGGKMLAPFRGRPLVLHALEAALGSQAGMVLLITGPENGLAGIIPEHPRLKLLTNPDPARGMGTSLALAAQWAQEAGAKALAVLLGDMPLVLSKTVDQVLNAALCSHAGAARALAGQKPCHPVAFCARHFGELALLSADSGGKELFARLGKTVPLVPAPAESFKDIDRPQDLA